MSPRLARYAWFCLAFTLAVILWGAFVRASGAGAGCGNHWPLCNGEVVPQAAGTKTLIELTHRVTSALSGLLVMGLLVAAFRALPKGHLGRKGAAWSMFFMLTEGAVGAALVKLEMVAENRQVGRAYWMSLHLVNTFLLLAAMTVAAWAASGDPVLRTKERRVAAGLGALALVFTLVLGTSGAVTALGDTLFPAKTLAEGFARELSTGAHVFERLRVLHPVLGLSVGAYVTWAAFRLGEGSTRKLAIATAGLFAGQVALGFLNMGLLAPTWLQLVHLLVADGVWISLVLTVTSALSVPRDLLI